MRRMEIIMAIVMGLCSIGLMIKSAELEIGWIPDEGPGGGAFPFWLAAGMLVCCIWIAYNWWRRTSPPSTSVEAFMDRPALILFIIAAGSLGLMIALIHLIGVYGSIPVFLIFYLRLFGSHSRLTTAALALGMPIAIFYFFEKRLNISLPKGLEWIENVIFVPLYDIFL
ncbi:MAG: tripartite tricarboxylate transporter TctB family protein [Ectothiorhodospiraceae bacterium AqS1]|nr:tripartite tricarboxylate transporter TctB family protein [Ectothiorhodospiraceae bacterium AqS1]